MVIISQSEWSPSFLSVLSVAENVALLENCSLLLSFCNLFVFMKSLEATFCLWSVAVQCCRWHCTTYCTNYCCNCNLRVTQNTWKRWYSHNITIVVVNRRALKLWTVPVICTAALSWQFNRNWHYLHSKVTFVTGSKTIPLIVTLLLLDAKRLIYGGGVWHS